MIDAIVALNVAIDDPMASACLAKPTAFAKSRPPILTLATGLENAPDTPMSKIGMTARPAARTSMPWAIDWRVWAVFSASMCSFSRGFVYGRVA